MEGTSIELKDLMAIIPILAINHIQANMCLATIVSMLNVQLLTVRDPLEPFDCSNAVAFVSLVAPIWDHANGEGPEIVL